FDPTAYFHSPIGPALYCLRAGDFANAEQLLKRCLELVPNHPAANGHLALHLIRSGRGADARAHCDAVLETMPHAYWVRAVRAGLSFEGGAFADAATDLNQCLTSVPDHFEWRLNRLTALLSAGDIEGAKAEAAEIYSQGADLTLNETVQRRLTAFPRTP
ncbi:MAG: putative Zn-dependent protease, partial [Myxococcota bacterium]